MSWTFHLKQMSDDFCNRTVLIALSIVPLIQLLTRPRMNLYWQMPSIIWEPNGWQKYGRTIIHISTDYVFDGAHSKPYLEDDPTYPVSVYGQSKLRGEQAVLNNAETAVIIRTAWLYSAHGSNFLKTMLRLGRERDHLNVVSDQVGTPTFAGDLAKAIVRILPKVKAGKKNIYHFTNEGVCSWYDFAHAIMKIAGLSCKVHPIESKNYPTKATRPFYSVLNKEKIKSDFKLEIPHWRDALIEVLNDMKEVE